MTVSLLTIASISLIVKLRQTTNPATRFSANSWALLGGLGLAIATTSAACLPHLERRIWSASSLSVTFQPTRRASASGSILRQAPHSQITRTRNWPKTVIEPLDVRQHAHEHMV